MSVTYRITMTGVYIADGHKLAKAVFPSLDGQDMTMSSSYVLVTFDTPQVPVDLGPLVQVEVYDPSQDFLP